MPANTNMPTFPGLYSQQVTYALTVICLILQGNILYYYIQIQFSENAFTCEVICMDLFEIFSDPCLQRETTPILSTEYW